MVRQNIFLLILFCLLSVLVPLKLQADAGSQAKDCPPCPCSEAVETSGPDEDDAPETVDLDELVEVYGPVSFTHLDHVDFADACSDCHHHSAGVERYQPCNACHGRVLFPEADKLNLPGLNAAYHRQCIGCHQDMESGPTGCTECHEPQAKASGK